MGDFNPYDQENTNRRIIEALESIAESLRQIKDELSGIKEGIDYKIEIDDKKL